jgi:hypothetical protein
MADTKLLSSNHQLFPRDPHSAILCGETGMGKTVFVLDLLEGPYKGLFEHIVIMCPTVEDNDTYQDRAWVWTDPEVYIVNPGERLLDWLKTLFKIFRRQPTLYIIDDCAAEKDMGKKRSMLSKLAFSGRHARQTIWVLSQRFNAVPKDFRTQTKWVGLFHCKDADSYDECLRENYVITSLAERDHVRQQMGETKHAKLILRTEWPSAYKLIS